MRFISEQDVLAIYSVNQCINAVEESLRLQQDGNHVSPSRTAVYMDKFAGAMLYMPAYVEDLNYACIKIVSVHPNNKQQGRKALQSVLILTNAETGEHLALMDSSLLTVYRTGALSGVATKHLAKRDASSCLIIGCGSQALGQISAMIEVRNLNKIMLYNRTKQKAEELKKTILEKLDWTGEILVLDDPNEGVQHADIIVCSTNSPTPVFDGNRLKPGTHINGIGSFQPSMQEVDVTTLRKSNKVVVDTIEGVLNEAGDFIIPIRLNQWSKDHIYGELGELVIGNKAGREADEEITMFKSVGFSLLDVVVAASIYNLAIETGAGMDISL